MLTGKRVRGKITDADVECTETQIWLDFALDCGYIEIQTHKKLIKKYLEVGKMLGVMIREPQKFKP